MPLDLPLPRFREAILSKPPDNLPGGPFYQASVDPLHPFGGASAGSFGHFGV